MPVFRGVYSFGRDIETREAAWKASLIFAGSGAVLTGISAWEALGVVRSRLTIPRSIHVAKPLGRGREYSGVSPALRQTRLKVSGRSFEAREIDPNGGLDLAKAPLALIDLAATVTSRELRSAFLEACRLGLFERRDVDDSYRRITGRRGAKKLRPLIASWTPELRRIRSVLEGLFLLAWIETGLPMPLVNVRVFGYEIDMYWPEQQLALELDGKAFHDDPLARARDRAKTERLEAEGLTVLRASFGDVDPDPSSLIVRIERELMEANCQKVVV